MRGKFYVDVVIGDERFDQSMVEVHTDSVTAIPPMWDQNHKDDSVLEIVDQRGNPRLQIIRNSEHRITVLGVYPSGQRQAVLINKIFNYPAWRYPAQFTNTTE